MLRRADAEAIFPSSGEPRAPAALAATRLAAPARFEQPTVVRSPCRPAPIALGNEVNHSSGSISIKVSPRFPRLARTITS
jgi:hypothetical protein